MKITTLAFLAISTVVLACLSPVDASLTDDYAEKYYPLLKANENDGTGQMGVLFKFFKEVPTTSQAEVLAQILQKGTTTDPQDYALIESVLNVSAGFQDNKVEWNAHLEKLIYAQAKSPDPNVRSLAIHVLAKMRQTDARDLILSSLNDPDENVRAKAIDSINKWPDAESIYQGYIQSHKGDVSYSKSLKYAQDNLNALQQKTK